MLYALPDAIRDKLLYTSDAFNSKRGERGTFEASDLRELGRSPSLAVELTVQLAVAESTLPQLGLTSPRLSSLGLLSPGVDVIYRDSRAVNVSRKRRKKMC